MKEDSGSRLKVIRDPKAILRIENPSEALIIEALRRDGLLIKHFKKPSIDMQLAAYRQNKDSAMLVDDPHPPLWLNVLHDQAAGGPPNPDGSSRGPVLKERCQDMDGIDRPLPRLRGRFTI